MHHGRALTYLRFQDSICPFCFLGKRKLDKAIATTKEKGLNIDFNVEFKPYLLDPALKEDTYVGGHFTKTILRCFWFSFGMFGRPVDKRAKYEKKFGGRQRMAAMEEAMVGRGKEVGINL